VNRGRLSRLLRKYSSTGAAGGVLVVDHDDAARALLRAMLEAEGWSVREAENGRKALARMEEERPQLVLLDLLMPEMDGFEFTEQVRQHATLRSVPIVVVTSHDLSREERQRLNGYVETVVQKAGDSPDALLHRVRELLGGFGTPERQMITRTGGERRALPA
jgi:CheY-like chemotaxis protein